MGTIADHDFLALGLSCAVLFIVIRQVMPGVKGYIVLSQLPGSAFFDDIFIRSRNRQSEKAFEQTCVTYHAVGTERRCLLIAHIPRNVYQQKYKFRVPCVSFVSKTALLPHWPVLVLARNLVCLETTASCDKQTPLSKQNLKTYHLTLCRRWAVCERRLPSKCNPPQRRFVLSHFRYSQSFPQSFPQDIVITGQTQSYRIWFGVVRR